VIVTQSTAALRTIRAPSWQAQSIQEQVSSRLISCESSFWNSEIGAALGREMVRPTTRIRQAWKGGIVPGLRFVAHGAVVLVAPGAKGFFEPGLGSGGKLHVLLCVGLRCRTPRGLPYGQQLPPVLRASLTDHEMEPEFDAGRDREHPVHGLGH
jgi:hypothetical protein